MSAAPDETITNSEEFRRICRILTCLGVTANYAGFYQTSYAVTLSAQNPERLQLVGKWLYPDVAFKYNTSASCVERNIRKTRNLCWDKSRSLLVEMAGHPLARRPGNARFLAILTTYLLSGEELR